MSFKKLAINHTKSVLLPEEEKYFDYWDSFENFKEGLPRKDNFIIK